MAEINKTYTSNTLWNDSSGIIACAEQSFDNQVDWTNSGKKYNGSYPDPEDPTQSISYIPVTFKTDANKFQSKLNEFFLNHWADWQKFLHEEGIDPHTIDSWYEVQRFLEDIDDSEAMTLKKIISEIEIKSGTLNITMHENIEETEANKIYGLMVAVSTSVDMDVSQSYVDPETGVIKLIYDFNLDS